MRVTGSQDTGIRLSNTWIIYPWVENNLGKLRLMSHRHSMTEYLNVESAKRPRMSLRPIMVVGGVMDHLAYDGYGH